MTAAFAALRCCAPSRSRLVAFFRFLRSGAPPTMRHSRHLPQPRRVRRRVQAGARRRGHSACRRRTTSPSARTRPPKPNAGTPRAHARLHGNGRFDPPVQTTRARPQADIAYTAYQLDGRDGRVTGRLTFVFKWRPGCASSAWLQFRQMSAPWRPAHQRGGGDVPPRRPDPHGPTPRTWLDLYRSRFHRSGRLPATGRFVREPATMFPQGGLFFFFDRRRTIRQLDRG